MTKLSVITVSYNNEDFIEQSIKGVLKFLPKGAEYIILDNGSEDSSYKRIKKYPKIKLIKSDINLGFSKGNNKAVEKANGEYLFFLNPDTEIKEDVFTPLINFYESHPDAGIVAPKLVMQNGQTQASVIKLPTLWGAVKEFVLGIKNSYFPYVPNGDQPVEVECAFGAAVLIKKELFNRLEGFDEKFFLYYEDVDLCRRVRNLGKKVYYLPGISIMHMVGATKSSSKGSLMYESSVKYSGRLRALIFQMIFKYNRLKNLRH